MSHISKIELEVKDLHTLEKACDRLNIELIRAQKTFRWYGAKAGACDHAIKIPGANYEIGVIANNGAYELQCDYYDRGIGKAVGENGGLLKQAYAVEKSKTAAHLKGYSVIERNTDTGIRLHVRLN